MPHMSVRTIAVLLTLVASAVILPVVADARLPSIESPAVTRGLSGAERLRPPAPQTVDPLHPAVRRVFDLVNAERTRRGLAPMRYDARLGQAAQRHSEDQAARRRMSHTGSDGSSTADRISRTGYVWRAWAENVASGQSSPDAVMNSWMNSSGHRRNILSSHTQIGVGRAVASDGRVYWTQVFATPG